LVRAFERGARRDHRPNIGLKLDSSYLFHVMQDSTLFSKSLVVSVVPLANLARARVVGPTGL